MKNNNYRGKSLDIDTLSGNIKSNRSIKKEDNRKEILYAVADKPLDFSFKELKRMEDLRKIEPRSGTRRAITELEREENDRNDNVNKLERQSNNGINFEDEFTEKIDKKPKKEAKESDIVEGKIHGDKIVENKGKVSKKEEVKIDSKKKVKYVTYTNSIILHSNKIKSLQNIHYVLNDILLEIPIISEKNRNKIELIQWLDISHNHLVDIHPDIVNLPFLKILYCHANFIEEIKSVSVLSQCKSLLNLTLHGNPIEHVRGYRQYIIEMIPALDKLDYTLVSEKELDIIFHKGSRYGEKRDKKGRVIDYPKIDDEVLKRMKKPKDEDNEKKDDN